MFFIKGGLFEQLRMDQFGQDLQAVDQARPRPADQVIVEDLDIIIFDGLQVAPARRAA